ncbi:MAG: sulfatase-like hydrolase/transferase [Pseudomonadales bacterium]|nr:sulfatase-like hydrolase/transferase [Pseudomonadales bacterium]
MRQALTILVLASFVLVSCSETTPAGENPNVIVIFTDDLGYADLSSFGATDYTTPNLDLLGAEGVRFTSFYVSQPVCTASRASLLTGSYSNRIGLHGAIGPRSNVGINSTETTLGELFQRNGYKTAIYGKWHLGVIPEFHPNFHGFDDFYGIPYSNDMWPFHPESPENWPDLPLYDDEALIAYNSDQSRFTTDFTNRSIDFIEQSLTEETPFFLYLAHPMPHVPLFVAEEREGVSGAGLYGDVIREIDWSLGEIVKTLDEHGIADDTLLIFTSDNGPWLSYGNHSGSALPFREGKGTVFEGGVRVPFIARWPGRIPAGLEVSTAAMTIDLFPTLAEILGDTETGLAMDGKSIYELLTGASTAAVQEAYYFYYGRNELQAMRSDNWKLHFPHSYRTMEDRAAGLDGIPGLYNYDIEVGLELFDLSNDISEQRNVADQNPEVVQRLSAMADLKRQELGDALTDIEGSENREPGQISAN